MPGADPQIQRFTQTAAQQPTAIKSLPSTWKSEAEQLYRDGMTVGDTSLKLDRKLQVVRAALIKAGVYTSTPRGEKREASVKLTVSAEQVERLRELLINACVEDQTLIPVLDQLPAEA